MRNPLSKLVTGIEPSGIRKFFDVVNEMEGAISLGVGNRILIRRGGSGKRESIHWKKGRHFIRQMPD